MGAIPTERNLRLGQWGLRWNHLWRQAQSFNRSLGAPKDPGGGGAHASCWLQSGGACRLFADARLHPSSSGHVFALNFVGRSIPSAPSVGIIGGFGDNGAGTKPKCPIVLPCRAVGRRAHPHFLIAVVQIVLGHTIRIHVVLFQAEEQFLCAESAQLVAPAPGLHTHAPRSGAASVDMEAPCLRQNPRLHQKRIAVVKRQGPSRLCWWSTTPPEGGACQTNVCLGRMHDSEPVCVFDCMPGIDDRGRCGLCVITLSPLGGGGGGGAHGLYPKRLRLLVYLTGLGRPSGLHHLPSAAKCW